jgi:hypothetical protein
VKNVTSAFCKISVKVKFIYTSLLYFNLSNLSKP